MALGQISGNCQWHNKNRHLVGADCRWWVGAVKKNRGVRARSARVPRVQKGPENALPEQKNLSGSLHLLEQEDYEEARETAQTLRRSLGINPAALTPASPSTASALHYCECPLAHSKKYWQNSAFETVIVSGYLIAAFRTSPAGIKFWSLGERRENLPHLKLACYSSSKSNYSFN